MAKQQNPLLRFAGYSGLSPVICYSVAERRDRCKRRQNAHPINTALNRCESCVLTHQAQLLAVTGDRTLVNAVATDYQTANLDPREQAILNFAARITLLDEELTPTHLQDLREVGLSDEAILEVGEVATQFNLSNRLSKAFGWKVKPGQFKSLS